jgi:hypothetical protein
MALPSTLIFDYPTISAISSYVASQAPASVPTTDSSMRPAGVLLRLQKHTSFSHSGATRASLASMIVCCTNVETSLQNRTFELADALVCCADYTHPKTFHIWFVALNVFHLVTSHIVKSDRSIPCP